MHWVLRYAPHLGYAPPDKLLFRELAGPNRENHVRFAAQQGMAGVLYPWAADSPPEERESVRIALQQTNLQCSCIVSVPFSAILDPIWVSGSISAKPDWRQYLQRSIQVAKDLGSGCLAVLIRADPEQSRPHQIRTATDRLRQAADIAASHGLILCVEPMIALPDMLLRTFGEGVDLVRSAAHPALKLIFDTGHVFQMGDPVSTTYIEAYDDIALLQLADMPGRVEPGAGTIDMVQIIAYAIRRGYRGLVDLEHGWSDPSPSGEQEGLSRLAQIEAIATRVSQKL